MTDLVAYHGDLLQTVADLAGGARVPLGLDSMSYVPTLLGKSGEQPSHVWLYWEFYERGFTQAVRFGNWKGVRFEKDNARQELYDLTQDIAEDHNVAAEHPDVVEQIAEIMQTAHVPSPDWPQDPSKKSGFPALPTK